MHSTDLNEFWSALLEKAYAKLHGSYEALMGGTTCEALSDFTGGITEMFELDQPPSFLFDVLEKGFDRSSMMGCLIYPHPDDPDHETSDGLICGHAYSITKAKTIEVNGETVQILRLRNPWGNEKEWNGAWCDKSKEWSAIDENLKKELGVTFDCDGEFWMSYEDFVDRFDHVEICNLSPNCLISDQELNWNLKEFKGEWVTGISAGGCRSHLETFYQNPQYVMKLEKPGEVVIALMQKNRRSNRMGVNFLEVGFTIYQLTDEDLSTKPQPTDFFMYNKTFARSNFINLREVSQRFRLEAGNYLIIPSTFKPNFDGDFWIRIYSENCSAFAEHDEVVEVEDFVVSVRSLEIIVEEKFNLFCIIPSWRIQRLRLICSANSQKPESKLDGGS
jgi:calpain, invertebrate